MHDHPPVLIVEREPDYWSRGHFHQGSKPYIDPLKVLNLPIGTKLYTAIQPSTQTTLNSESLCHMALYECDAWICTHERYGREGIHFKDRAALLKFAKEILKRYERADS